MTARGYLIGTGVDRKEKFTLFFGYLPVFSNFYQSPFVLEGKHWRCVEQYYHYKKAKRFGDKEAMHKILLASKPRKQKKLGQRVKNFKTKVWASVKEEVMLRGVTAKVFFATVCRQHYKCLPVKLIQAQNSLHSHHEDGHFCSGTNDILKDLAVLFGSHNVFFLSQDDKARIPMGLPAANKQAPLLMNVHYKIALPDHDWTKAPLHKLIPSVYAGCQISDTSVQYVGPTYVAIRSAKHYSSTSITHSVDFEHLLELDQFKQLALDDNEQVKPILIVFVDGGPDENPHFLKTMIAWTYHMKKHNLNAVFVSTYAPGQSAFNPVERRMAPLSHDLSGVILKHDVFGSHLDKNGRTINEELEKKNFKNAGEQLGKVCQPKLND